MKTRKLIIEVTLESDTTDGLPFQHVREVKVDGKIVEMDPNDDPSDAQLWPVAEETTIGDAGGPESGPRPYEQTTWALALLASAPPETEVWFCAKCGEKKGVRGKIVVNERYDPTEIIQLTCGHVIM